MSDRALWLDEWCPTCRAPGGRCRVCYMSKTRPPTQLHVARGWRARSCPTCKALADERCRTPSGREASRIHQARLRPGRCELLSGESVWQELEARGAMIATVMFSGRAGRGGRTERIMLSRLDCDELVDVERWTGRDELCYALEAPIWDRLGSFAGQPVIVGAVIWTAADRRVVIEGRRGADTEPSWGQCRIIAGPAISISSPVREPRHRVVPCGGAPPRTHARSDET